MFKLTLNPKYIPSDMPADERERLDQLLDAMTKAVRETMEEHIANMGTFGISHPEILIDTAQMNPDDFELVGLRDHLHEAAILADQQITALPENLSVTAEIAKINEIMKPGDQIAGRMFSLKPTTPEGVDAKLRAGKWKTGDYIKTYLRDAE